MENSLPEPLTKHLGDRLRGVVGDTWVIDDADRLLAYESDGLTAYRRTPRAVVLPRDTDEISCVLGILSQEGVPAVPRGAGTGLSGGALADGDAVVVGTARMTDLLELDPANRLARVQPGMINANLTTAAEPFGLYYAPDPSSQSACTLGGNVAENSGGPHCLKYGVTSRYVTGLTVVAYDGKIMELGGFGRESGGYDLLGVFVGSEGCFGIATEIEVRLLPKPDGVSTLLAIFDRLKDAGSAVTEIMAEGLLPAALEIIDGPTIRAVEASVFAAGYPTDAEAALVVEFDGVETGLAADAERAVALCREAGAREVRTADSDEERLALWRGRKKAFGAMGQIASDLMVQDGTVPRSKLTEVLGRISEIGVRHNVTIANVFHAGDGNLHPNLLFDRSDPEELSRVDRASTEIMAVCVEAGGTITGEHGIGMDKRRYMSLVHSPVELDAMQRIKDVFDPLGGMNPGKVLPDSPDAEGVAP